MRPASALVPLRVIGVTCMGEGDEQDADAVVEVPEGVAARHPGLFVVHGIGSCMDRRFPEDAALGVDPDMVPRTGDAVLVRDEAHGSFIHVYMAGSGGTVMLSADSWQDGYEDLVVGPRDPPVEVLGTVVWWQAYEDVVRLLCLGVSLCVRSIPGVPRSRVRVESGCGPVRGTAHREEPSPQLQRTASSSAPGEGGIAPFFFAGGSA